MSAALFASSDPPPAAIMPRMSRKHSILVVDDEPDVVQSVKDLLRLDYKVFGATSPADALKILADNPIDVVMTDQRMPEMSGVEFLQKVRDPHPDATRLLFTGYADISAVIDAINQGNVYRYIAKPWDPDELQTIIREACERHDLIVQRKELTEQLERKNAELEKANAELSHASALKSAFIQVASHELRTPLAIAGGFAELAVRQPDVREPMREWLDRIHRALRRLGHLVNQIIAMLESEQFERPLNRKPVALEKVVAEAVEDVRPFAALRAQKLVESLPPSQRTVWLDPEKIRDCVNHLVLNAIKFTPDGGTITVEVEAGGAASAPADGAAAVIRVSDTGCGIDPTHLPHVGEAFFTGYDVTRHASGHYEHGRQGLGLGLSVVKSFVAMHGGTLRFDSQVQCGTTVTITLPAAAPPEPAA